MESIYLAIAGLSLSVIVLVVSVVWSWFKIVNGLKLISQTVSEMTLILRKYMGKSNVFREGVSKDLEQFRNEASQRNALCHENKEKLIEIDNEIRLQNNSQEFMKEMFKDLKSIQSQTTTAINNLENATIRLGDAVKNMPHIIKTVLQEHKN